MYSSYFVLSMHLQTMDSRGTILSLVETLAHAHHVSHLTWRSGFILQPGMLGEVKCGVCFHGNVVRTTFYTALPAC